MSSIVYWACREAEMKKCRAITVTMEVDGVVYIKKEKGEHTHSSDLLKKRVHQLEQEAVEND